MSVLSCDRNGCKNIMCDLYSYDYGYICGDCYSELLNLPDTSIKEFMESKKQAFPDLGTKNWENYIASVFKINYL